MSRAARLLLAAVVLAALGLTATWAARRFGATDASLHVTGTIEGTQVDVSAKMAGRIVELPVREGQRVERGQLLARLEAPELEAEARRSEAAIGTATARLRDLEAGTRVEEIREAEARAARAAAQLEDLLAGARQQEIEQARAALRNARATREWTEADYRRIRQLFAKDLVAAQEVDRARQAYEVALANEQSARERVALVEAGPRAHEVAAARAELTAARERVALLRAGPRPEAVAAARAQVAEARATLDLARARLAEARLTAPISGVVLRRNLELGETTGVGTAVLTLLDPADLWLRAYVPETDVGRIRVGQRAAVTVDAFPGRPFPGAISEIASEAEFTPRNVQTKKERVNLVFRIKIALQNVDGVLKPGLPADAELVP
ncbi:MAG: HlyD family efflux transporter periplasmic adaptor subunit [Candidatus Rokubacteria bacterium]|nr:HlyD family efflux transporter periplasmic adaptor subunit [Candidatus Rokubacteria bacterium]